MGVIAAQLGHTDTRMTEKHYAHLAPSYIADTIRAHFPTLGMLATLPSHRSAAAINNPIIGPRSALPDVRSYPNIRHSSAPHNRSKSANSDKNAMSVTRPLYPMQLLK